MAEALPVKEGRLHAEEVRRSLNLGDAPIRDLFGFMQRTWSDLMLARRPMPGGPVGALVARGDLWLIVINTHNTPLTRQRFTAAHELAHFEFDRESGSPLHVDVDLYRRDPAEVRANAFAVHFLLPEQVLQSRINSGQLDVGDDEQIVSISFEYGLSRSSLAYHLYNTGFVTRRRCDEIQGVRPWSIAARIGLGDRVQRERDAIDDTAMPRRLAGLAAAAFVREDIDRQELSRLLPRQGEQLADALDQERRGANDLAS